MATEVELQPDEQGTQPRRRQSAANQPNPMAEGTARLRAIIEALQAQTAGRAQAGSASFAPHGPVLWERSQGPGGAFSPTTRARSVTGGFAPGTVGATFQEMLPRIMQSLFAEGGSFGGPKREDLLNPRLADLDEAFASSEQNILNRFAGLGRDVTGSVPTGALADLGSARGKERSRAMGDVDTLLAQLGIQQQGAATQRLQAIMQIMQSLGIGR